MDGFKNLNCAAPNYEVNTYTTIWIQA
jgi:hypothetical protein